MNTPLNRLFWKFWKFSGDDKGSNNEDFDPFGIYYSMIFMGLEADSIMNRRDDYMINVTHNIIHVLKIKIICMYSDLYKGLLSKILPKILKTMLNIQKYTSMKLPLTCLTLRKSIMHSSKHLMYTLLFIFYS